MKKLYMALIFLLIPKIGAMVPRAGEVPSEEVITELYVESKRILYDGALYLKFLEVIKPSIKETLLASERQRLHIQLPVGVLVAGFGEIIMKCLPALEKQDSKLLAAHYADLMAHNKHDTFSQMVTSAKVLGVDLILSTAHAFLGDAAAQGKVEFVKSLLRLGADVNQVDDKGLTPLMKAAQGGFVEVVDLLIDHKAVVEKKDGEGCTALMSAAKEGHVTVVQRLIARGASKDTRDNLGTSVLEHAALKDNKEILKELGGQEGCNDVALFKRKIRAGLLARKAQGNISRATDMQEQGTDESKQAQKKTPPTGTKADTEQKSWFSFQNGLLLGLCAFGAYLYYYSTKQSNQKSNTASCARE